MQVNDLFRQGKADAGFAAFPHVEALKDVGQISLGNAISIVLYPDYHIPFVGPAGQTQLTAGIPQSVGQDIRDRPAHLRVIAFDHDGFFREVRRDGNAAGSGCRFHGAYAVVEQFSNIRFGKGKRLPPHIDF